MKSTPAYTRYAGISFSYLDGDSSYSSGSGENKVKALNIYGTQIGAKGHYLDLVLKYSQLDNDFKVLIPPAIRSPATMTKMDYR